MKKFKFYLTIDAENLDDAQRQLEDLAGDGGSFGDLEHEEVPSEQLSFDELAKFLNIKDKYDDMFRKVQPYYSDWQGWSCNICYETVGSDTNDMFYHLQEHTIEELKENEEEEDEDEDDD